MDLKTRTSTGSIASVGGIFGVATLPGHTRVGVCSALMEKAHEYFRERNHSFSFLCTNPTLVAHSLYTNLGYFDLIEFPTAYKTVERSKEIAPKQDFQEFNLDKILRIYRKYVKGRTGLVVRDEAHLNVLMKHERLRARDFLIDNQGYAIFKEDRMGTWIRELVALNQKQMQKLLNTIEDRAEGPIYDRGVFDQSLLEVYGTRGYMTLKRGHSVLMYKPLTDDASIKDAYGDEFFLTRLDSF
jgi:predicted acetyltransferase